MRFHDRMTRRQAEAAAAALVIALLAGCSRAQAPPGMLPPIEQAATDPYGSWVTVQAGHRTLSGELIAVDDRQIWILPDTELISVPRETIDRVQVENYEGNREILSGQRLLPAVDRYSLRRLGRFARFPAGLPADLDRSALRARPVGVLAPDQ